jgi:DNA-binding IscR family transcriptional regulator
MAVDHCKPMGFSAKTQYGLVALNPDNITVADVVAALNGSSNTEPQREPDDPAFLVLASLEQELEASKEAFLTATTLAQLLREHDAFKQPLPMFYI